MGRRGYEDGTELEALRDDHLVVVVAASCGMVQRSPEVRSVHVIAPGRPTYAELRRMREINRRLGVPLEIDGFGRMSVRRDEPRPATQADSASLARVGSAWAAVTAPLRMAERSAHWMGGHLGAWSFGFQGLSEGTR